VPLEPSEPNKPLLNGVALLLAIVVGMGVGLLVSLVRPVISNPHTLIAVTGLPLLGAVTLNLKPEQKRREVYGVAAFASLCVCLMVVYIGMSLSQGGLLPS